jgi:parallel beta-helix repeat protein
MATHSRPSSKFLYRNSSLDLGGRHKNRRLEIARNWATAREPAAVEPLATVATRQDDPDVRLAAVQALGALGGGQAATTLAALLGDKGEGTLHGPAITALGQAGDEPAVKALIGAWGQVEAVQREAIGQALVKLGPARTVEPLIAALGHASAVIRERAEGLLRKTAIPEAVVVTPDGSGNFRTLEEAVANAAAGAVIRLKAGEHTLAQPLHIEKPLTLLGEGMERTQLLCDQRIHISGDGPIVANGVTFKQTGSEYEGTIIIMTTRATLYHCRVTSIEQVIGSPNHGALTIYKAGQDVVVAECEFVANGLNGIVLYGDSKPVLLKNECRGHYYSGIVYLSQAGGTARHNICIDNGGNGITAAERASPSIEGNTCNENDYHGIRVGESAQPTLIGNECKDNKGVGIGFFGKAGGIARGNRCTGNYFFGIQVDNEAKPVLEDNTCQANRKGGISYAGSTDGTACRNKIIENGVNGIQVLEQAQPTLEGNQCERNKADGIAFGQSATGIARQNRCINNSVAGIRVADQAHPTLEENTCEGNNVAGIVYNDAAGGTARRNRCTRIASLASSLEVPRALCCGTTSARRMASRIYSGCSQQVTAEERMHKAGDHQELEKRLGDLSTPRPQRKDRQV